LGCEREIGAARNGQKRARDDEEIEKPVKEFGKATGSSFGLSLKTEGTKKGKKIGQEEKRRPHFFGRAKKKNAELRVLFI